ncbi:hypothetical protein LPJ70_000738 [Coemansia sp. RSA 2708]|nr:hypothetical protein LPJ70_000738 [Coemansia sp. RSA 2708]
MAAAAVELARGAVASATVIVARVTGRAALMAANQAQAEDILRLKALLTQQQRTTVVACAATALFVLAAALAVWTVFSARPRPHTAERGTSPPAQPHTAERGTSPPAQPHTAERGTSPPAQPHTAERGTSPPAQPHTAERGTSPPAQAQARSVSVSTRPRRTCQACTHTVLPRKLIRNTSAVTKSSSSSSEEIVSGNILLQTAELCHSVKQPLTVAFKGPWRTNEATDSDNIAHSNLTETLVEASNSGNNNGGSNNNGGNSDGGSSNGGNSNGGNQLRRKASRLLRKASDITLVAKGKANSVPAQPRSTSTFAPTSQFWQTLQAGTPGPISPVKPVDTPGPISPVEPADTPAEASSSSSNGGNSDGGNSNGGSQLRKKASRLLRKASDITLVAKGKTHSAPAQPRSTSTFAPTSQFWQTLQAGTPGPISPVEPADASAEASSSNDSHQLRRKTSQLLRKASDITLVVKQKKQVLKRALAETVIDQL